MPDRESAEHGGELLTAPCALPALVVRLALAVALAVSSTAACSDDPAGGGADAHDAAPSPDAPDAAAPDAADAAADPGGAADAADVTGPPSTLYVHHVDGAAQLIGGPAADGQVGGAWVIGNARARFVVQDVGVAWGLSLYGGNLIDADIARLAGAAGGDLFREAFPIVNFRVLVPDKIEVVADGADGLEAVLRVTGTLGPSRIIDFLDDLADPTPVDVRLDYIVRPDQPWVTLRTTVANPTDKLISVVVADFLSFGGHLALFTRDGGLDLGDSLGTVDLIGAHGDGASYAYAPSTGSVDAPFVDTSGTAAILDGGLLLAPGEAKDVDRVLAVGDGSLSSVVDAILQMHGTPTGTVAGTVADAAGTPVPGARVTPLLVRADGTASHAGSQAISDAAGQFSLTLPPGSWDLVAHGQGRVRSAALRVELAAGASATAALAIGDVAVITVDVTGEGWRPADAGTFPVKVGLQGLDVEAADPRLGEHTQGGLTQTAFLGAGLTTLRVKPGRYDVYLSHGPEHERLHLPDMPLTDGATLAGHLARSVDTDGWVGCDFHQHTVGSLDADSQLDEKVRENLTAGLECFAVTDHDNVTDIRPTIAALGAGPALHGVVGDEVSVSGVGHFNAFPLPLDPAAPYELTGLKLWVDRTIDELFAALRALPGQRAILLNHPRSNGVKGYFTSLGYNPWSGDAKQGSLANDFDGIEVNAELGDAAAFTVAGWQAWAANPTQSTPVLADWFGFLNRGVTACAIGNSDSHDVGDDAGYPRTYLKLTTGDDPGAATDAAIVDAIARQHAVVARGAFLKVATDAALVMGHTEPVTGAGPHTLHVTAQTAPWLSLDTVELYANGLLVASRPTTAPADGGAVWFDDAFEVSPAVDTWYVVLTRGSASGWPVFGGSPFAFTNPIYVDVAGDGFDAPGPVALP